MARLQNYINNEETERAKNDGLIDTVYNGLNPEIKGKKGKAHLIIETTRQKDGSSIQREIWYFTPVGGTDEYRVNENSLNFEK